MEELMYNILKDYVSVKTEVAALSPEAFGELTHMMMDFLKKETRRLKEILNLDSLEAFLLDVNETAMYALFFKIIRYPHLNGLINPRKPLYQKMHAITNTYYNPGHSPKYAEELILTEEEIDAFKQKVEPDNVTLITENEINRQRFICSFKRTRESKEICLEITRSKHNASVSVNYSYGVNSRTEKSFIDALFNCVNAKLTKHPRFRLRLLTGDFQLLKI